MYAAPLRAPPAEVVVVTGTLALLLAEPVDAELLDAELLDAELLDAELLTALEEDRPEFTAELLLLLEETLEELLPELTDEDDLPLLEEDAELLMVPPTAREDEEDTRPADELRLELLLERLIEALLLEEELLLDTEELLLEEEELLLDEEEPLLDELPLLDWALSVHGAIASETAATVAIAILNIAFIMLNFMR